MSGFDAHGAVALIVGLSLLVTGIRKHQAQQPKHVAMLIGMIGGTLGFLITGSFIVETIFGLPGIGRYFVNSVTSRDYSVTMGITVMLSAIVIAANMVVDILYVFIDPRVRLS